MDYTADGLASEELSRQEYSHMFQKVRRTTLTNGERNPFVMRESDVEGLVHFFDEFPEIARFINNRVGP